MPTPDEIRVYHQARGEFLSALWDDQIETDHAVDVSMVVDVFQRMPTGAPASEKDAAWLVNGLEQDRMIEAYGRAYEETYPHRVRFTSFARSAVSRWIGGQSLTSELLPLPATQIFQHFHGPIQGSTFVTGSSGIRTTMNNSSAVMLGELVCAATQLLDSSDPDAEQRDQVEDDLATLTGQSAATEPDLR